MAVRRGLGLSGLAQGESCGDVILEIDVLSGGGRGESGTFHKLASSGRSSSASLYSASSSFTVFLFGCHDPRRMGGRFNSTGASPGLRDVLGPGSSLGSGEGGLGDGERERLELLIAVMASEGVEAFLKLVRMTAP